MKSKILIFAVVIVAVLALSLLSTVAYLRWFDHGRAPTPRRAASPSMLLRGELALTEAQTAELEALRASFDEGAEAARNELRERRRALMEELRAVAPDTVRIDQLVEEIGSLQATLEKQVIRHMLREQAVLTPEQREQFLSMFHKRFQEREGMPWGRGMGKRGRDHRPAGPNRKGGR